MSGRERLEQEINDSTEEMWSKELFLSWIDKAEEYTRDESAGQMIEHIVESRNELHQQYGEEIRTLVYMRSAYKDECVALRNKVESLRAELSRALITIDSLTTDNPITANDCDNCKADSLAASEGMEKELQQAREDNERIRKQMEEWKGVATESLDELRDAISISDDGARYQQMQKDYHEVKVQRDVYHHKLASMICNAVPASKCPHGCIDMENGNICWCDLVKNSIEHDFLPKL